MGTYTNLILEEMAKFDFSAPLNITIQPDIIREFDSRPQFCQYPEKFPKHCKTHTNVKEGCRMSQTYPNKPIYNAKESISKRGIKNKKGNKQKNTSNTIMKTNNIVEIKTCSKNSKVVEIESDSDVVLNKRMSGKSVDNEKSEKLIDNNNFEDMNDIILDMLKKVSEYLLIVICAHRNHLKNTAKNVDPRIVQESKKRYTAIKNNLYQLSYCTVSTVLIPGEKEDFSVQIINQTIDLALQKQIKLTVQQVQPFYYEMLSWVKHRNAENFNGSAGIARLEILNKDSSDREIRITIEPNNVTQENQIVSGNVLQRPEKQRPLVKELSNQGLGPKPHDTRCIHSTGATVINTPTSNTRSHSNSCQNSHLRMNYRNTCRRNIYASNPMNMLYLPTYEEALITRSSLYNESIYDIVHDNQNNYIRGSESYRCSVSTDSGYKSSHFINAPYEDGGGEVIGDFQPIITHVTSLNPTALHITEGNCSICKSNTKQMCLGCYQVYYCSFSCQKYDWATHKFYCKANSVPTSIR